MDNGTEVKITDFGYAILVDSIREDEDRCGTPAYIAESCLLYIPYIPYWRADGIYIF